MVMAHNLKIKEVLDPCMTEMTVNDITEVFIIPLEPFDK